jgi:hypothetical protein
VSAKFLGVKKIGYVMIAIGWQLLLTACLTTPVMVDGEAPTPVITVELIDPTAEASPVPPPIDASPDQPAPHFVTQEETAVYSGPGLAYERSHFLGPDTTVSILGRNAEGGWWAIHGPGDGPGPHSWVADADVTVVGDTSHLPILTAPDSLPDDAPLVGEMIDAPPTERCIIAHPGMTGPINIHLGPGEQFTRIAQLGQNRWVEGIAEQGGWFEVRIGIEQTGWVKAADVAVNERCPTP